MMKQFFSVGKLIAIIFLFVILFFDRASVFAADECQPCPAHDYYKCEQSCGGKIEDWWAEKCCSGAKWVQQQDNCDDWQKCDTGEGKCYCDSSCLKTPPNPQEKDLYYDNPEYENNPAASVNKDNIHLPVKLDWIDKAWQDKSSGPMKREPYGVQSFWIRIPNSAGVLNLAESVAGAKYDPQAKMFTKLLDHEYFDSVADAGSCFFNSAYINSSLNIDWYVKSCCKKDGTDCGPERKWNFKTSDAPELISPYDPDWNGPKAATDLSFKGLQIKWCRTFIPVHEELDKSYKLLALSDENPWGQYGTLLCHPLLKVNDRCVADAIPPDPITGNVIRMFPIQGRNDHALFTRDRIYQWPMSACVDEFSSNCGDYSQSWKFSTRYDPIGIPEVISPKDSVADNDVIGLPIILNWTIPDGANSFNYQTSFIIGTQTTTSPGAPNSGSKPGIKEKFDAANLKADTKYKWRVQACSRFDSTDCDGWTKWFLFRTTGRPPKSESMKTTDGIPVTFSWEAVPGAKCYNFSLSDGIIETATSTLSNADLLLNTKYTIGYPEVDQAQSYAWKIQTCAHSDCTVCGQWSQVQPFTTPELTQITGFKPSDGSTIYADQVSQDISWDATKGAKAYHYTLTQTSSDEKQGNIEDNIDKIVSRNSDMVQMNSLGAYRLAVRPCVDSGCKSVGPEKEISFVLAQHVPENKSAFALCGAGYDDPGTPWNEREPCQLKHLLLLAKVSIDFLLFRLAVILLPILVLITGIIFYSQFNTPEIWEKVKLMWRAIGIGYAILIFAWIITGFLLQIAGYSGLWWKIL